MTIFNENEISSNEYSGPLNPGKMKDGQMEISKLLKEDVDDQQKDEESDNIYIFPEAVTGLDQNEITYKCVFHLEPAMLSYYYTPINNVYSLSMDGTPVPLLQGSPLFDGFYETKWQVSVNLNRWIGMHRWMSVYLTRVDENQTHLQVQCEFKLFGKNGLVVCSQRNNIFTSGKITKGMSIGFGKFLPFSEVVKHLIDGNKLSMEVHLMLFYTQTDNGQGHQMSQDEMVPLTQESHPNSYSDIDDCFYCPPTLKHEEIPTALLLQKIPNCDLPVVDRVELQLNEVRVAYVSREKLKEKSPVYVECLQNNWNCTGLVNFALFSRESPVKQIRAMQDFVNFVHGQPCAFLANGSYRDVQVLLQFALKCDTEDLIRRCLSAMTLKVDCENATDHSRVIQKFSEYLYKEDFEFFRNFFKDNFDTIRKTQRYKELRKMHSPWLISLLFE